MYGIILAGGRGTRLKDTVQVPKPLAPINGMPFLALQISFLANHGISDIYLSVGYQYQAIIDCIGDSQKGVSISYSIEHKPLGTGGAIRKTLSKIDTDLPVFVLNGDTFCALNYEEMYTGFVESRQRLGLALTRVDDVGRYGEVRLDDTGNRIIAFTEKNVSSGEGLINSGVYLLYPGFFDAFDLPMSFSLEKDCLHTHISDIDPYPYVYSGTFIDIGIPDDYQTAQTLLKPFTDGSVS